MPSPLETSCSPAPGYRQDQSNVALGFIIVVSLVASEAKISVLSGWRRHSPRIWWSWEEVWGSILEMGNTAGSRGGKGAQELKKSTARRELLSYWEWNVAGSWCKRILQENDFREFCRHNVLECRAMQMQQHYFVWLETDAGGIFLFFLLLPLPFPFFLPIPFFLPLSFPFFFFLLEGIGVFLLNKWGSA